MNKRNVLISFRKSLGLTIEDVSNKTGYTATFINNIELGKSGGSLEFWFKFQDVFGIENEYMWNLIRGE